VQLLAATRTSPLALWQTREIEALLQRVDPTIELTPVLVDTPGDLNTDVPLSQIGGKGVFVKNVEAMILDGRADIAVHSGKDMPAQLAEGLIIAAVPERGDARDCLVGAALADVPTGGSIATGSPRRRAQLKMLRPDLVVPELRGNIGTRLKKSAGFDAIVMATTALVRLEMEERIAEILEPDVMLPQVAQGSLAVECVGWLTPLVELLAQIEHPPSRLRFDAERAFLDELGGDCELPAGAYAELDGEQIFLRGVLASPDGSTMGQEHRRGTDADEVGRGVARALLDRFPRAPVPVGDRPGAV